MDAREFEENVYGTYSMKSDAINHYLLLGSASANLIMKIKDSYLRKNEAMEEDIATAIKRVEKLYVE